LNNWIERRRTGEAPGAANGVDAAPAATVVLLRDGSAGLEVLLARRSSKLAFHGGAWVFPGGRIDPGDYGDAPDDLPRAARRAAVREAKEEAGVDVDAEALVHLSNWTTPEGSPKRFATWFFVGPVAGGAEVADGAETEVLRLLESCQLTAKHQVATPVNWKKGEDVIIVPAVSDEQAKAKYPSGWKAPKPYLRIVPMPE